MAPGRAAVCAVGMVTPIGGTAPQTMTSIRAGISRYAEHPLDDAEDHTIVMALLPDDWFPALNEEQGSLGDFTDRERRMLWLAAPALREAKAELPAGHAPPPLYLALPEPPEGVATPPSEQFLGALAAYSGVDLDLRSSCVFRGGRTAGLQALSAATASGLERFALVGGVDTHLDSEVLALLELDGRLLTEGATDGFAPGEGAGFLLLRSAATKGDARSAAILHEPGFGREPGHRASAEPYRGDGLATAITAALRQGTDLPVHTTVSSFNGENMGAKEWGVSFLRNHECFHEDMRLWHPADCFGDAGTAAAPLLLGFAALGMRQGLLHEQCLVWCSSDDDMRAAVCLSAAPTQGA